MARAKKTALTPAQEAAVRELMAMEMPKILAGIDWNAVCADLLGKKAAPVKVAKKPRAARPAMVEISATPADPSYDWELRRHRGWLNHFVKLRGKEWKRTGPSPLEPGCTIRPDVLREFADRLEEVRTFLAAPKEPEPV